MASQAGETKGMGRSRISDLRDTVLVVCGVLIAVMVTAIAMHYVITTL